jgi:F-type H+-transporting ATPase subunit delta
MQAASRAALAEALERLAGTTGSLPEGAGSTEVAEGLFSVADLLGREPSLRRALADPATPAEVKGRLLDALLADRLSALPLEAVRGLVMSRWSRPGDLLEAVETVGETALLAAAEGEGALDDVEDELFRFGRIVDREPALRAALTDSGVPAERRLPLLRTLLEGKTRPATARLLERALTDPVGRSFDRALEDVVVLAAGRRDQVLAVVRVADPLTEEQTRRMTDALTRSAGRQVRLQVEVDPTVLGGAVVDMGDEVVDGSIARRLDSARRRLAG